MISSPNKAAAGNGAMGLLFPDSALAARRA